MICSRFVRQSLSVAVAISLLAATPASACTRCLRAFADGNVIVGRSMDWMEDPGSEIWVFPRGMKRHGNAGPGSLEWTSRFGSVGVSFYGVATADGMNEKGLVVNILYLAESDYGTSVAVFSVIRNASAPLGITTPGEPNVASTLWRTVHDHKDRTLYFDSATSPTVFWVPLEKIDFAAGSPVRKLPLKDGETYSGDASGSLRTAEPYSFLNATPK